MEIDLNSEQISKFSKCLKRELAFRKRVYPKFIANGKMGQVAAEEEINTMQEIITYFDKLALTIGPEQTKLF